MKKMNKKFVAGTAFALGAAAALTGCGLPQPNVYGPAPSDQVETNDQVEPNAPVYGPPEAFDTVEERQATDYGPPDFEVEEEIQPDVYGPPEGFDEAEEVPEILYGPPEVLGLDDPDDWD